MPGTPGVWASRWEGGAWQPLGQSDGHRGATSSTTPSRHPSHARARGRRHASSRGRTSWKVSVARYVGSMTWNVVGTPFGDDFAHNLEFSGPVVHVNATGVLFATKLVKTGSAVHPNALPLNGGAWQALGDPPSSEGSGQDYDFALDGTGGSPRARRVGAALGQQPYDALSLSLVGHGLGAARAAAARIADLFGALAAPHVDRLGRIVLAWTESGPGSVGVIRVARGSR